MRRVRRDRLLRLLEYTPEFRSIRTSLVRAKLWLRLWQFARERGITISLALMPFTSRNVGASSLCADEVTLGCANHDDRMICMSVVSWSNAFVLAHEIGHLCASKRKSEWAADRYGARLVESLLSPEDFALVEEDVERYLRR